MVSRDGVIVQGEQNDKDKRLDDEKVQKEEELITVRKK